LRRRPGWRFGNSVAVPHDGSEPYADPAASLVEQPHNFEAPPKFADLCCAGARTPDIDAERKKLRTSRLKRKGLTPW